MNTPPPLWHAVFYSDEQRPSVMSVTAHNARSDRPRAHLQLEIHDFERSRLKFFLINFVLVLRNVSNFYR